jgi:hypothetical protein
MYGHLAYTRSASVAVISTRIYIGTIYIQYLDRTGKTVETNKKQCINHVVPIVFDKSNQIPV